MMEGESGEQLEEWLDRYSLSDVTQPTAIYSQAQIRATLSDRRRTIY